jgi:hypothetical protein
MDSPEHTLMAAAVRAVREKNLQERPAAHGKVADRRGKVKVQMDHYSRALASDLKLRAHLNEDSRPKVEGKKAFNEMMDDVSRQILGTTPTDYLNCWERHQPPPSRFYLSRL